MSHPYTRLASEIVTPGCRELLTHASGGRFMSPAGPKNGPCFSVAILYYMLAGFFFALAIIGIILPFLPTTPFLLLTSYFLVRVSPRLHSRLLNAVVVGPILQDWHAHRAIRKEVRWRAVTIAAVMLSATAVILNPPWTALIALLLCGATGIVIILRLPMIDSPPALSQPKRFSS